MDDADVAKHLADGGSALCQHDGLVEAADDKAKQGADAESREYSEVCLLALQCPDQGGSREDGLHQGEQRVIGHAGGEADPERGVRQCAGKTGKVSFAEALNEHGFAAGADEAGAGEDGVMRGDVTAAAGADATREPNCWGFSGVLKRRGGSFDDGIGFPIRQTFVPDESRGGESANAHQFI